MIKKRDVSAEMREHTVTVPWYLWPDIQKLTAQMRRTARSTKPLALYTAVCYIGKKPLTMNGQVVCRTQDRGVVTKVPSGGKMWVHINQTELKVTARTWRRV